MISLTLVTATNIVDGVLNIGLRIMSLVEMIMGISCILELILLWGTNAWRSRTASMSRACPRFGELRKVKLHQILN
jgi:hypothetical protein